MDLGAYAQIDDLEQIMKDNGIEIPRLRGLRLMKDEAPFTKEDLEEVIKDDILWEVKSLIRGCPKWDWNSCVTELSSKTDALCDYYLWYDVDEYGCHKYVDICWDRIHGKKRKACKYVIKKVKKRVKEQFDMWNKYVDRDDVLYIHARLGSGNWGGYDCDKIVKGQPWYLDHCEDHFDCTYVDIYAKIKEVPNDSENQTDI